jgi:hypothetical protein
VGQKKRDRTTEYFRRLRQQRLQESVQNEIEQWKFDKLVRSGFLVAETAKGPGANQPVEADNTL